MVLLHSVKPLPVLAAFATAPPTAAAAAAAASCLSDNGCALALGLLALGHGHKGVHLLLHRTGSVGTDEAQLQDERRTSLVSPAVGSIALGNVRGGCSIEAWHCLDRAMGTNKHMSYGRGGMCRQTRGGIRGQITGTHRTKGWTCKCHEHDTGMQHGCRPRRVGTLAATRGQGQPGRRLGVRLHNQVTCCDK